MLHPCCTFCCWLTKAPVWAVLPGRAKIGQPHSLVHLQQCSVCGAAGDPHSYLTAPRSCSPLVSFHDLPCLAAVPDDCCACNLLKMPCDTDTCVLSLMTQAVGLGCTRVHHYQYRLYRHTATPSTTPRRDLLLHCSGKDTFNGAVSLLCTVVVYPFLSIALVMLC